MKNVKIKGYRLAVIVILAMMPIMMSAVEYKNMYQPVEGRMQPGAQVQTTSPSATFQSTSTLTGSGSALSATPMLGADGTATLGGAVNAPGGPRRENTNPNPVVDETDDDGNTPIGDAVLPLLLLALAYLSTRVLLKSRALSR